MKIKMVGRDVYVKDNTVVSDEPLAPSLFYAISLVVFNDDENVEVSAEFIQTETLTEAFAGITEYGALKFNTVNSNIGADVEFKAITVDSKEEVVVTKTLNDLMNMEVGSFLI